MTFIVGYYITIGKLNKAQELFDKVLRMIDKQNLGGKDLPMEVLIKKGWYRTLSCFGHFLMIIYSCVLQGKVGTTWQRQEESDIQVKCELVAKLLSEHFAVDPGSTMYYE